MPGAKLLVGYPPFHLAVTTSTRIWKIQPEQHQPETHYENPVVPTISRNGKTVACARLKAGEGKPVFAIATYSLAERTWKEYWEGKYEGPISISPDGSTLAYAPGYPASQLHFVQLRTGKETLGPVISSAQVMQMSWSPDSSKIVYDRTDLPSAVRGLHLAIEIYDLAAGKKTKIADGEAPSWSPSGEWVAYFGTSDGQPKNCTLVHPDGTGAMIVAAIPSDGRDQQVPANVYVDQPVWSPDSKKLLLEDSWNQDLRTVTIHLLDLSTSKMTTVFRNAYAVFGWAENN
jgi:Tol biopolymer transport system component